MQLLLVTVARWLVRHLLSLALIVGVLLAGRAAWFEWQEWRTMRAEKRQLEDARQSVAGSLKEQAHEINARAAALRGAPQAAIEVRITAVDSDIARKQLERQQLVGLAQMLAGKPWGQAQLQAVQIDGAIGLLQRERAWLQDVKRGLLALQSAANWSAERERVRLRHESLYVQWHAAKRRGEALERENPIKSKFWGTDEYLRVEQLTEQRAKLLADIEDLKEEYRRLSDQINSAGAVPPPPPLAIHSGSVAYALRALDERIGTLRQLERDNWVGKFWRPVQEVLPTALLILLGAILIPIGIKAFFYFVLAPLAARRPPVRLLPQASGALTLEGGRSSVSRSVTIDAAHELLVHPEFLQSTAVGGEKATQWLLDWRFPLTSLSSGMAALTRIRSDRPEAVVISANQDAFAEVGVLDLPAGSAVVMQPHNLVGVIQPRDMPMRITAHWRLASMHAWLTLQFRYLALHGPARLIVQGRRGVRVDSADAGRAVNQAATIAFSANVAYSTRRCETFAAYLLARQELLNDCFGQPEGVGGDGQASFFVYEELPRTDRKAGITGRGLEGLSDSVLKVLGV